MEAYKWKGTHKRVNVAGKQAARDVHGFLVKKLLSDVLRSGPIFDFMKSRFPDIDFTRVTVNKNLKSAPHRDKNSGSSWVLILGDFTGGALVLAPNTRCTTRGKLFEIKQGRLHWVESFRGTLYSVVLYRKAEDEA